MAVITMISDKYAKATIKIVVEKEGRVASQVLVQPWKKEMNAEEILAEVIEIVEKEEV
jgi:hypothetical protein